MKKSILAVIAVLLISFAGSINAQTSPINVALVNPIQIVPEGSSVSGLRLSLIYGKNANVTGIDLGLVNHTTGKQSGIQWGFIALNDGGFTGLQMNGVNISKDAFLGVQDGIVNIHSGHFTGLQIGLFNSTETLKGVQLGLINMIKKGGFLPIFPFFNFSL